MALLPSTSVVERSNTGKKKLMETANFSGFLAMDLVSSSLALLKAKKFDFLRAARFGAASKFVLQGDVYGACTSHIDMRDGEPSHTIILRPMTTAAQDDRRASLRLRKRTSVNSECPVFVQDSVVGHSL